MIDIQALVLQVGSQYKFAKMIDRKIQHVNMWHTGKHKPSKMSEERIERIMKDNGIEI